jgi:phage-related protein
MSTFTWSPAPGATQGKKPAVRSAQFGDGYEQRAGDGINSTARTWLLTFKRLKADADAIDAFLSARNGVELFDWTPPYGAAGKWLCREWTRATPAMVIQEITATFEEKFGG